MVNEDTFSFPSFCLAFVRFPLPRYLLWVSAMSLCVLFFFIFYTFSAAWPFAHYGYTVLPLACDCSIPLAAKPFLCVQVPCILIPIITIPSIPHCAIGGSVTVAEFYSPQTVREVSPKYYRTPKKRKRRPIILQVSHRPNSRNLAWNRKDRRVGMSRRSGTSGAGLRAFFQSRRMSSNGSTAGTPNHRARWSDSPDYNPGTILLWSNEQSGQGSHTDKKT